MDGRMLFYSILQWIWMTVLSPNDQNGRLVRAIAKNVQQITKSCHFVLIIHEVWFGCLFKGYRGRTTSGFWYVEYSKTAVTKLTVSQEDDHCADYSVAVYSRSGLFVGDSFLNVFTQQWVPRNGDHCVKRFNDVKNSYIIMHERRRCFSI